MSLDISTNFVPPGFRSNISTHLQYTAINGVCPPVCESTLSDNTVVKDNFFQRNISITLSYLPSEWLPWHKPLTNAEVRIKEEDLTVETSNSELHRLNFNKLRFHFKLNKSYLLNTCTINCSSIVRSTSFNNVSNCFTAKQQNFSIDNQDKTIFMPTVFSNIIKITNSNLATPFTSPTWDHQQHHLASYPHFTSFSSQLYPSILPDPVVNVITIPPNISRKKTANKYKLLVYKDVDEHLYSFKTFRKCIKCSSSWKSTSF